MLIDSYGLNGNSDDIGNPRIPALDLSAATRDLPLLSDVFKLRD